MVIPEERDGKQENDPRDSISVNESTRKGGLPSQPEQQKVRSEKESSE